MDNVNRTKTALTDEEIDELLKSIEADMPEPDDDDSDYPEIEPEKPKRGGKKKPLDPEKAEADRRRRAESLDIRRRILMATDLSFSIMDYLSISDAKTIISRITEDDFSKAERFRNTANKHFTAALNSLMPGALRNAKRNFPGAFLLHPGFPYETKAADGEILKFWVSPDVPYYFPQFTEVEQMKIAGIDFRPMDQAIRRFYRYKRRGAYREVFYATKLLDCKTYYDLIKKNPVWLSYIKPEVQKYMKQ